MRRRCAARAATPPQRLHRKQALRRFDNVRIYIYTFEGVYIYEPFAIYETRYDSNYIRTGFTSFDDFKAFTDKIKGDATKVKDVEITESDRIITMSTCTNGAATARYALHAKLVDYIVD